MKPRIERLLQRLMDLGERLFSVILFAFMIARNAPTLVQRPYNIVALISEGLVVYFILFRRRPRDVTTHPVGWLVALAATGLPMLVVGSGAPIASATVGVMIMIWGLLFGIWTKLTLGRSFGIAAANRGIVDKGPYAMVRHPMYASYLLVHIGFLLLNPNWWNAAIYASVWCFQFARIMIEEQLLSQDPVYVAYATKVKYRLVSPVY